VGGGIEQHKGTVMDTATSYLGLQLPHPFMAGASPMSADFDTARRLEDAGCAAIVMHSLFEEQITLAENGTIRHMDPHDAQFTRALAEYPDPSQYPFRPDEYLNYVQKLKAALHIPVIASLNGTSAEGWMKYARLIQEAGSDALEVNMYDVVADLNVPGTAVETTVRDLVLELKRAVHFPIAVKLTPFYSAFGNFARALDRAGADGLVLFNRFYQPDIDIKLMAAVPSVELSHNNELPLRLRWLAILHGQVQASLALTGGVGTPADAIKGILAGAHVVQLVSSVLRHGPSYFTTIRDGLEQWMEWHKFPSVDLVRGRVSLEKTSDPSAFERANYVRTLQSWNRV